MAMGGSGYELTGCCADCGLPYEEHGIDIHLKDEHWDMVSPSGDTEGNGLLCGTCIARRVSTLPGAIVIKAHIDFYEPSILREQT